MAKGERKKSDMGKGTRQREERRRLSVLGVPRGSQSRQRVMSLAANLARDGQQQRIVESQDDDASFTIPSPMLFVVVCVCNTSALYYVERHLPTESGH